MNTHRPELRVVHDEPAMVRLTYEQRFDAPSFIVAAIGLIGICAVFGACLGAFYGCFQLAAWLIGGGI